MYNVAVIGKGSYIGGHIASELRLKGMTVTEVDSLDNKWSDFDFASVDTVIHVAAIVHRKDITDHLIYEAINVQLPLEVARRAEEAGVKQFVFMSSMAVYGKGHVLKNCCIEPGDLLNPTTEYAKSKLKAEQKLQQTIKGDMILSIIRPPSVYGRGCKGNLFDKYNKIAKLLPWMPECEPDCLQGVVHIDNLCRAVYAIVKDRKAGCYHPQDDVLLSTAELLGEIRKLQGKKTCISRFLGKVLSVFSFLVIYKKLFGAVYYSPKFKEYEALECPTTTTRDGLKRTYCGKK
ncbi:MAG: NAD-dependent epimerase/dehydratase family protein [Clostridia bacterium]|nr:NAD-dependent epimerase/dehydratase family protein [Clostridia bacterium]